EPEAAAGPLLVVIDDVGMRERATVGRVLGVHVPSQTVGGMGQLGDRSVRRLEQAVLDVHRPDADRLVDVGVEAVLAHEPLLDLTTPCAWYDKCGPEITPSLQEGLQGL